MKQIKYYVIDDNYDLKEISEDNEIVKTYNSAGIEVASSHGYEAHQLLKLTILPVDIKLAPIKELPIDYVKRNRLQKQQWLESRESAQKILDKHKENKRPNQEKLFRFNSSSEGYFAEYDKSNDPRNRINLSKRIYNKRKGSKNTPSQDDAVV